MLSVGWVNLITSKAFFQGEYIVEGFDWIEFSLM